MDALYREYSGKIFDFLYKYSSGNPEIAMDLMQDTFLNFFRKYSDTDIDQEQAIRLLYTIARNRSINYSRKFSTVRKVEIPKCRSSRNKNFLSLERQN